MSGHTPGPWVATYRKGSDQMYRTEIFATQHGGIATCEWNPQNCGNGVTKTYREANARLIAAAPDLLKALTDLIANQDATWVAAGFTDEQIKAMPYLKPAREAIAKATGVAV